MSGSGLEALSDIRETHSHVRERSGSSLKCPGVVWRPSRMSGCGWEALLDVRVWSGGPPGCPGVVGRPSQTSGSGRDAILDVQ